MEHVFLWQLERSGHERTSVLQLVDVLVILISRCFLVVEAVLGPCCIPCILILATKTHCYSEKLSNGKGEKSTICSYRLQMELRPWRDPLLMLENEGLFPTHFHCIISFFFKAFSVMRKQLNMYKHCSIWAWLKSSLQYAARLKETFMEMLLMLPNGFQVFFMSSSILHYFSLKIVLNSEIEIYRL